MLTKKIHRPVIRRFVRFLRHEQQGVSAMEFALISPVLMMLTMGTIEFSMVSYAQSVIESATFNASRLGKTGFVAGSSRQQGIVDMLVSRSGGLLQASNISITTSTYSNFSSVGQPEGYVDANHNGHYDTGETFTDTNGNGQWDADMGAAGLGVAGDVVVYVVNYPWQISTPLIGHLFTNSTVNLSARAVVKNEPF